MVQNFDIFSIYEEVLSGKLKRFPLYTWSPHKGGHENAKRVLRYLIHDKLKWDRETFCSMFNHEMLIKYRLQGAVGELYDNSMFAYVSDSLKDWNIKAWELVKARVPFGFWNQETTREAIKWMIEEKLKWNYEMVSNHLSASIFEKYNLAGMLMYVFSNSPVPAIKHAYPEQDWTFLEERAGYKLTPSQAEEIRFLVRSKKHTQRKIAEMYNISPALVSMIVNGKLRSNNKK